MALFFLLEIPCIAFDHTAAVAIRFFLHFSGSRLLPIARPRQPFVGFTAPNIPARHTSQSKINLCGPILRHPQPSPHQLQLVVWYVNQTSCAVLGPGLLFYKPRSEMNAPYTLGAYEPWCIRYAILSSFRSPSVLLFFIESRYVAHGGYGCFSRDIT